MKRNIYLIAAALALLITATACRDETPKTDKAPAMGQPAASEQSGTVLEAMNTSGYTYVLIDTGHEKIWAASTEFPVKVGDKVLVSSGIPMENYQSKTLNRTFDLVIFADNIRVAGTKAPEKSLPKGHPGSMMAGIDKPVAGEINFSGIERPEGGKTVAELYAEKSQLSGRKVVVRGKVVKFNPQIMEKNWIHLQDGSGAHGNNDLTVTTSAVARVGDTILVSGVLVTDKDYAHANNYEIIIEDAQVIVE